MKKDLTTTVIPNADGPDEALKDYSLIVDTVMGCQVVFRNHVDHLIRFIQSYDTLLGAVAWFTDSKIIAALRNKRVSIIVQKEDFLRPDLEGSKPELQRSYSSVESQLQRFELPGIAATLSVGGDPTVEPFRCVGNHNQASEPAMPRMHNKFLVGCNYVTEKVIDHHFELEKSRIIPRAVWTGSYNFSLNARSSFENAMIISNERVAEAYLNEWSQLFAISERLDWNSSWIAPEYRIGT